MLWGAEDVCDFPYRVRREYLNAFMFTRILEGSLHYEYRGKTFIAQAGDIVLQDCKLFNHYWAEERVRLQFIHFSEGVTQPYCDMLYEQYGACFRNFSTAGPLFDDMLTELQKSSPNDHQLSFLVTDLFRQLSIPQDRQVNPSVRESNGVYEQFLLRRADIGGRLQPCLIESVLLFPAFQAAYFAVTASVPSGASFETCKDDARRDPGIH